MTRIIHPEKVLASIINKIDDHHSIILNIKSFDKGVKFIVNFFDDEIKKGIKPVAQEAITSNCNKDDALLIFVESIKLVKTEFELNISATKDTIDSDYGEEIPDDIGIVITKSNEGFENITDKMIEDFEMCITVDEYDGMFEVNCKLGNFGGGMDDLREAKALVFPSWVELYKKGVYDSVLSTVH